MSDLDNITNKPVTINDDRGISLSKANEVERHKLTQLASYIREHNGQRISDVEIMRELRLTSLSRAIYYLNKLKDENIIDYSSVVNGSQIVHYTGDKFTHNNISVPKEYKKELVKHKNLDRDQRRLLIADYIERHNGQQLSSVKIATALNIKVSDVTNDTQYLMSQGNITKTSIGYGRAAYWSYHRVPVPFNERQISTRYRGKKYYENLQNGEVKTVKRIDVPVYWADKKIGSYFLPLRKTIIELNGQPIERLRLAKSSGMASNVVTYNLGEYIKRGFITEEKTRQGLFVYQWHDNPTPVTPLIKRITSMSATETENEIAKGQHITATQSLEQSNSEENTGETSASSATHSPEWHKKIEEQNSPELFKIERAEDGYAPLFRNSNWDEKRFESMQILRQYLINNPDQDIVTIKKAMAISPRFDMTDSQLSSFLSNSVDVMHHKGPNNLNLYRWRKRDEQPMHKWNKSKEKRRRASAIKDVATRPIKKRVSKLEYYAHIIILTAAASGAGYALYDLKGALLFGCVLQVLYGLYYLAKKRDL